MQENPANRTDGFGLLANGIAALVAVLVINGLIALANPTELSAHQASPLTPPGYVIGLVWIGLFLCMAIARWCLLRVPGEPRISGRPIVVLALLCLLYPLYTAGLRSEEIGLLGNLVTLAFTLWVIWRTALRSRPAALWVSPVAVWLAYATLALAQQVRA